MFYIFYGDEEYTRSEKLASFKRAIDEDGMGELNISVLDGRQVELGELISACNTLPFFTNRRLIIVNDMLGRFERRGAANPDTQGAERLASCLAHMPETTRLVFVESGKLSTKNELLKRARDLPGAHIQEFSRPDPGKIHVWIAHRAREKGSDIEREAITLLIAYTEGDLRRIDQELEKLAALTGYERPIRDTDVRSLVSSDQETRIFDMVDNIGEKQRRAAFQQMHALLAEGAHPLYLLTMIVRQFRLLLATKDLRDNQHLVNSALERELGVRGFVVDKLIRQAELFTLDELERLIQSAVHADLDIKTGQIDSVLALEMLVLDACRRTVPKPGSQRARNRSRTR